ncbi:hypothetical protein NTD86_10300 [Pseudomonas sp. 7P_10.2_Bac1]|uniref:hypothetical protein n=1 Tax=Pseudomonas sp. 7P_10.2_Bac1 TaxID=2971614 RepID=UPI0021C6C8C6|nr:hypothetical protein [Pseudomonas sp. 7P_10.2_Bac1]MCU1727374.1 hypothetical protein [Pseudomonas sp. 7P_10.2_Bac1]
MTFKAYVLPGVRAFTSSMRVKLSREPSAARQARTPFSTPIFGLKPSHQQVQWRVSPATGQLEQRWSMADLQEPQRRALR